MMNVQNPKFPGLSKTGLILAVQGVAGLALGLFTDRTQFFHSYLLGFSIFFALSMGALVLTMIHQLTGGAWGFMLRRTFEACMANIPLMAVLAVPIVVGLPEIYSWATPENLDHRDSVIVASKQLYLNPKFFVIRLVAMFAIWTLYALFFRRSSMKLSQLGENNPREAQRLKNRAKSVAGPGIVVYCLTITFASLDLLMSLTPTWFSTVYAMIMGVTQALFALAFGTAVAAFSSGAANIRSGPQGQPEGRFHDLGNLMLAFTMLWGYTQLSQYLIIWSANMPEEISWYLNRTNGSWLIFTQIYLGLHFVVPFLILLFRRNKRDLRRLGWISCLVMLDVVLDFVWFINPTFSAGLQFHWLDLAAIAGVGGIWLIIFVRNMEQRPMVPAGDPDLPVEFLVLKGGA